MARRASRCTSPRARRAALREPRRHAAQHPVARGAALAGEHASRVLAQGLERARHRAQRHRRVDLHAGGRTVLEELRGATRPATSADAPQRRGARALRQPEQPVRALRARRGARASAAPAAGGGCPRSAPASAATARCSRWHENPRTRVARRAARRRPARACARAATCARINALMGNARIVARALRPHWRAGMRIAELGAGDGALMRGGASASSAAAGRRHHRRHDPRGLGRARSILRAARARRSTRSSRTSSCITSTATC